MADGDDEFDERVLLVVYADAVRSNRTVIGVDALRFRWALTGLLVGIVYSALAGGLVASVAPQWFEVLVAATVTTLVLPAVYGIYTEDFLVVERRGVNFSFGQRMNPPSGGTERGDALGEPRRCKDRSDRTE